MSVYIKEGRVIDSMYSKYVCCTFVFLCANLFVFCRHKQKFFSGCFAPNPLPELCPEPIEVLTVSPRSTAEYKSAKCSSKH